MAEERTTVDLLAELLNKQDLAVLATQRDGQPCTNLVSFAVTDDWRHLYFATPRASRKFASLRLDDRVALMIDNRNTGPADLAQATAVNAIGRAREITGGDETFARQLLLAKHPALLELLAQPDTALINVEVQRYTVVSGLADVRELSLRDGSFRPAH